MTAAEQRQDRGTGAPWSAIPFDESQTVIVGPEYDGGKRELVATVSVGKHRPNGHANARLIAAAPQMLAALEALTDYIAEEYPERVAADAWVGKLHDDARAAIAAARADEAAAAGEGRV